MRRTLTFIYDDTNVYDPDVHGNNIDVYTNDIDVYDPDMHGNHIDVYTNDIDVMHMTK